MVRKAFALIGLVIIATALAAAAFVVDTINGFRTSKGTSHGR